MVGVILHSSGSQGRRCSHFLLTVLFVAEGTMAATEGTMAATESLRVLVTGASGYLGQFLLDEMLRRNQTVGGRHIIAGGTYTSRPDSIPSGVQPLHLDLQDSSSIEKCLATFKPDVVINLAALSSPAACEKNKAEALALNAPVKLLDALAAVNAAALFIQVSTDQIYDGDNPTYTEDSTALPVNTYGSTKLLFEEEIRKRWPQHVILRSSLIYGPAPPRACSRKDSFLQFLDSALSKEDPVSLFADEVRCPIYVDDVTAILLAFLSADALRVCTNKWSDGGTEKRTFQMGGPQRLSRVQMGQIVCSVRSYPPERLKISKRSELDLGFTSPLDISMDSRALIEETLWVKQCLANGKLATFEEIAKRIL